MTAPRTTYSPSTIRRSACVLITSAVGQVPAMYRAGATRQEVADHLLVAGLLADDLYADAQAAEVAA